MRRAAASAWRHAVAGTAAIPKIAIMPSPTNWFGDPPGLDHRAGDGVEEMIQQEHHVIGQAPFHQRRRSPDVDEHDGDEMLAVAAVGPAPPPVVGGDVGRQQRQDGDVLPRAELAGEAHAGADPEPREGGLF